MLESHRFELVNSNRITFEKLLAAAALLQVGNYGGAWYRQQKDFAEFPGAVLMTTNCIIEPRQTCESGLAL